MKPAYTATEKLLADTIREALRDLDQAFLDMRQQGWHHTQDRNLKMLYLGVNAAMAAQDQTYKAANAVIDAKQAGELSRLPAWNGYPDDDIPEHSRGAAK